MQVEDTALPEVKLLTPRVFADSRGAFSETFNARVFHEALGFEAAFVQDNQSVSAPGVLRGLHYQIVQPQGKLIRVVAGAVFDVAVDLRRSSLRFGHWTGHRLDAETGTQMWVPVGFAHGFLALAEGATVLYKTTDFYAPSHERTIRWDDPALAIRWPVTAPPQLSEKDAQAAGLAAAALYP